MTEDLYRALNVSKDASIDDIHHAYRAVALRYHPDRNPDPGAAVLMALVNRAYEILINPLRRAEYDKAMAHRGTQIDETVMEAAREVLLKRNWTLVQEDAAELTLRSGSRRVHILFSQWLNSATFDGFHRRSTGFCSVLAVRVQPPVAVPSRSAVILDLMHSRLYGGDFPDVSYKELFKPFLAG